MTPYNTICLIWKTETEALPIPILGWFESFEAARLNAARVIAVTAPPELAACPVTITPIVIPPETVQEFFRNQPKTERGKKK